MMVTDFFRHNNRLTLPREDAMAFDVGRRAFVAADGVTRDWDGDPDNAHPYPDPSPATDAADAAAAAALQTLLSRGPGEATAHAALEAANAAVGAVNARLGLSERCDWLEFDLAGAVAAVSVVEGDTLFVGWIGDCGVAVIRDARLAYLTRDQLDHVQAHLAANPAPYNDARRVMIRSTLRNRPSHTAGGAPITYGVLTGEPDALAYIETAAVPLRNGDVVATHTDGFRPYFARPDFLAELQNAALWEARLPTTLQQLADSDHDLGRERSIILYRHGG